MLIACASQPEPTIHSISKPFVQHSYRYRFPHQPPAIPIVPRGALDRLLARLEVVPDGRNHGQSSCHGTVAKAAPRDQRQKGGEQHFVHHVYRLR